MVTVSTISGVSMPIIDEKRLGKPPPTKWWSSPSDHAIAPQWGLWGVVCTPESVAYSTSTKTTPT